jgi:hypothetical protein
MATFKDPFERLHPSGGSRASILFVAAVVLAAIGASAVVAAAQAGSVGRAGTASSVAALAPRLSVAGAATLATPAPDPTTSTPAPTSTAASIVPTASRVAAATKWVRSRQGLVAFAVIDSSGKLSGYHVNMRFVTASVVKAMLLVGYLRTHTTLSAWAKSTLTGMIHVSDNNAATAIYKIVGDAGLRKVAKVAGMRNFSVSVSWGRAQLTPADQARFFYKMDKLIPKAHDAFARYLLSHITASQSWGIPATARPKHWTVFFKDGSLGTTRGQLVHQVARLEKGGTTFAVAVMTDGDPSMRYGINTIVGVTRRLLWLAK